MLRAIKLAQAQLFLGKGKEPWGCRKLPAVVRIHVLLKVLCAAVCIAGGFRLSGWRTFPGLLPLPYVVAVKECIPRGSARPAGIPNQGAVRAPLLASA